jgi:hypothetical protein
MMMRASVCAWAAVSVVVLAGPHAHAGPITPPPGPVAGTYKTLAEVEPRVAINSTNTPGDNDASPSVFKITTSGSYYLTGHVSGASGKIGIEIAASHVTLDLSGFAVLGVAGSNDGIGVRGSGLQGITIRNGSVRDWGGYGIDTLSARASRIEGVTSTGNGIFGFQAGERSVVTRCVARSNTNSGFVVGQGSSLSDVVSAENGSTGIAAGTGSSLVNCAASGNGGNGFNINSGSTITSSTSNTNGGSGILGSNGSTITACTAQTNSEHGIETGAGATIVGCSSRSNSEMGIFVAGDSTVSGCTVTSNGQGGISASSRCVIVGNTSNSNGTTVATGAGILITGTGCRLEANSCASNDLGIDIDGVDNLVIRNSCTGNGTNYTIVAGNGVAQIESADKNASAINGSFYTGTIGTTDPFANFSY